MLCPSRCLSNAKRTSFWFKSNQSARTKATTKLSSKMCAINAPKEHNPAIDERRRRRRRRGKKIQRSEGENARVRRTRSNSSSRSKSTYTKEKASEGKPERSLQVGRNTKAQAYTARRQAGRQAGR